MDVLITIGRGNNAAPINIDSACSASLQSLRRYKRRFLGESISENIENNAVFCALLSSGGPCASVSETKLAGCDVERTARPI